MAAGAVNPMCGPVVLLQGPISGFFGALAHYIKSALDIAVVKIHFNWADEIRDRAPVSIRYTGTIENLEQWYAELFGEIAPRAVVCFGDERAIHAAAREVCRKNNIAFYAFDEGYIRPDYVTLERIGTNANSVHRTGPLPIIEHGVGEVVAYGRNILPSAGHGFIYNALMALGSPLCPHYVHHRQRPFWTDAFHWTLFFFYNRLFQRRDIHRSEAFVAQNAKAYYVTALQVYDDLQLRRHGRGWTPEKLIEQSIASFARSAPASTKLVIKQHPLDTGHRNYSRCVAEAAARHGVADRVIQMRYANQMDLLKQALGVVTINSTLGISALQFGCPVLTLGDSIYCRPGLALDGNALSDIDKFWRNDIPVDGAIFQRFRSLLVVDTQINGDFYIRRAWGKMFAPICAAILGVSTWKEQTDAKIDRGARRAAFRMPDETLKDVVA